MQYISFHSSTKERHSGRVWEANNYKILITETRNPERCFSNTKHCFAKCKYLVFIKVSEKHLTLMRILRTEDKCAKHNGVATKSKPISFIQGCCLLVKIPIKLLFSRSNIFTFSRENLFHADSVKRTRCGTKPLLFLFLNRRRAQKN